MKRAAAASMCATVVLLLASARAQTAESRTPFDVFLNPLIYDRDAPVLLSGEVLEIMEADTNSGQELTKLSIRLAVEPDGDIWIVAGPTSSNPSYEMVKNLAGAEVIIRGYQTRDKRCRPECRALGRDVTFPPAPE